MKLQLQTFKDAVASLKDGNSLVTFAEGTRSVDGRLGSFKKVGTLYLHTRMVMRQVL